MSRESDMKMLEEFCGWAFYVGSPLIPLIHSRSKRAEIIRAFLAAREPTSQANSCARCGHSRSLHDDSAPMRVSHEFAAREPPATEPQEFWAVGPTFAPADHWLCVRVFRDGTHNQYGVPRKTREEAEADGLASGLPRWHEAIPSTLPTEETKP